MSSVSRQARHEIFRARLAARIAWLSVKNRLSQRTIIGPGPMVSLTTHGDRVTSSYLTIESIASGALKPSRVVLCIDDESILAALPASLRRLQRRGLQVKLTKNWGPHTKYYPIITEADGAAAPLVTADDDIVYPRSWLADLWQAHTAHPEAVNCYRARRVLIEHDQLLPYAQWPFATTSDRSPLVFATGVGGVIYPHRMLAALRDRGESFVAVCPRADDVWLHQTAVRNRIPVRLVSDRSQSFPVVAATQGSALKHGNVEGGGNDVQIRQTYEPQDIASMMQAAGELGA